MNKLSQLCCNEFEQFVGDKAVVDSNNQSQPFDKILVCLICARTWINDQNKQLAFFFLLFSFLH